MKMVSLETTICDFDATFAQVAHLKTIRMLLAFASCINF